MNNKKFISIIKYIWIIAVVIGGGYYVYTNYQDIVSYLSSISEPNLLISFFLLILVRIFYMDLVKESLVNLGWFPKFTEVFSFVSVSQLGKYIPGGVWHFVARYSAYKDNHLSIKDIGKSFFIENYWVVTGSLFFSMFLIIYSNPASLLEKYNLLFLLTNKQIFLPLIAIGWLTSTIAIDILSKIKITRCVILRNLKRFFSQAVMWLLYGLSFLSLLPLLNNLDMNLFTIGSIVLSFLIGFIAIIAPGGIGIREFAGIILFSSLFTETEVTTYLLVHRFLYTIVEFMMGLISYIFLSKNIINPDKLPQNE